MGTGEDLNGAQALMRTLVDSGVTTCFSNPGTSEMHFVAALDSAPEMRAVLALFEGVATGAADGYARMAGKPAATLLHLGPGLGNGLANLHNARKGQSPVVNIVGDHATYHRQYNAPLQSDIETVAANVSPWVRTSASTAELCTDAAEAVAAASGPPGQVATLILPADVSWTEGGTPAPPKEPTNAAAPDSRVVDAVAAALRSGEPTMFLLGGTATLEAPLILAGRLREATGARLLAQTFPTRIARGAGLPAVGRLPYLAEAAAGALAEVRHLVLVDAPHPASFFAYPDLPSDLVSEGCTVHHLAPPDADAVAALTSVVDAIEAPETYTAQEASRPERPSGDLTAESVSQAIGALLPKNAIVSDEANTAGFGLPQMTVGAPRHDWLTLTGGAIGQGLPVAVGAAVACPDRKVLALQADGSALYTIQALWTMAREELDVVTVIFNNRSYAILNMELQRVGADGSGPKALSQLDLSRPDLDFVSIAQGFGVPAVRPTTAEEFTTELERALAEPGPHLIEAVL
ncbi:acetolactate synthase large subunit [Demetria terragena]|uniref:acetolactate synthase large subunit n=1 Tax=Demetria terragena TaxID=63959 RepID=UPI00037F83CF|nr:acetolactate synthase large subunit [Demetria terragena]